MDATPETLARLEIVAKAIWDAQDRGDEESGETPSWDQLSDHMDSRLKDEFRLMAKAAIKASDGSRSLA